MTDPTPTLNLKAAVPEAMRLAEEAKRILASLYCLVDSECYDISAPAYKIELEAAIDRLASLVQPPEAPAANNVVSVNMTEEKPSRTASTPVSDGAKAASAVALLETMGCEWPGPNSSQWRVPAGSFSERTIATTASEPAETTFVKPSTAAFDSVSFNEAIRKHAALRHKTMKEVSAATGVSETTLSRMQQGRRPDAASLAALSAWAGINPASFMCATGIEASRPAERPPEVMLNGLTEAQTDASASVQGLSTAVQVASGEQYFWLVELFHRGDTGNSLGRYHTGTTYLHGQSCSTGNVYEAKRYATKEQAEKAAANLKRGIAALEWRAVEHGFIGTTPSVAPIAVPDEAPMAAAPDPLESEYHAYAKARTELQDVAPSGDTEILMFLAGIYYGRTAPAAEAPKAVAESFYVRFAKEWITADDAVRSDIKGWVEGWYEQDSPTESAPAGLSPAEVAKPDSIEVARLWEGFRSSDEGQRAIEYLVDRSLVAHLSTVHGALFLAFRAGLYSHLAATSSAIPAAPGETGGEL